MGTRNVIVKPPVAVISHACVTCPIIVCKAVVRGAGGNVWVDTAVSTAVVVVITGSVVPCTGSAGVPVVTTGPPVVLGTGAA